MASVETVVSSMRTKELRGQARIILYRRGAGKTMDLRDELAVLWKAILHANPKVVFGNSAHRLESRPGLGDEIPQPGFVGTRYRAGGVFFLGKNPGKGAQRRSREDALQFEAFRRLREAERPDLRPRFEDLMQLLAQQVMPTWYVVQNYVAPVLSKAGAGLDDIAYLNLLKWRSEVATPLVFDISWESHTGEQYTMLRPALVVAIGRSTRDRFEILLRRSGAPKPEGLLFLERSRRDAMPPPASTIHKIPEVARKVAARLNRGAVLVPDPAR